MRKALLAIVILVGVLGGVQVYYHRFDCGKEVVEYGDLAIEQVITTTPYRDWKGNCHVAVRERKMDGDYQIKLASFYRVEPGGIRVKVRGPSPLTMQDCYRLSFAFKRLPFDTKMKEFWHCRTNSVEGGNERIRVRGKEPGSDFISLAEVARRKRLGIPLPPHVPPSLR
jgi:hypothetical protein